MSTSVLNRPTRQRPLAAPQCKSASSLASWLLDFMSEAGLRRHDPWTPSDKVAFARDVVNLLPARSWLETEIDAVFSERLPGYCIGEAPWTHETDALGGEPLVSCDEVDAVFAGIDLDHEMARG